MLARWPAWRTVQEEYCERCTTRKLMCNGCNPCSHCISDKAKCVPKKAVQTPLQRIGAPTRRTRLPAAAVAKLEKWFSDHRVYPYPTENDRLMLITDTQLPRKQVDNWLNNARARQDSLPVETQMDPMELWLSSSSEDEAASIDDIRRASLHMAPYHGMSNTPMDHYGMLGNDMHGSDMDEERHGQLREQISSAASKGGELLTRHNSYEAVSHAGSASSFGSAFDGVPEARMFGPPKQGRRRYGGYASSRNGSTSSVASVASGYGVGRLSPQSPYDGDSALSSRWLSNDHIRPPTSPPSMATPSGIRPENTQGYKCDFPGCTAAPFQNSYLLHSHTNVHSTNRPHYCPVPGCPRSEGGKGFKRKNEMIRHGVVHDSPGYVCPFCSNHDHKYRRPDNLQRHVRVHHPDQRLDDPLLREVFAQLPKHGGGRGRRRRRIHDQESISCHQCPYVSATSDEHDRHLESHTGVKAQPGSNKQSDELNENNNSYGNVIGPSNFGVPYHLDLPEKLNASITSASVGDLHCHSDAIRPVLNWATEHQEQEKDIPTNIFSALHPVTDKPWEDRTSPGSIYLPRAQDQPFLLAGADIDSFSGPLQSNQDAIANEPIPDLIQGAEAPIANTKGLQFQCTFCYAKVSPKAWKRHEESQHLLKLQWTCMPMSTPAKNAKCVFCGELYGDTSHDDICKYRISDCLKRSLEVRTFSRKDKLTQHVDQFHKCSLPSEVLEAWCSNTREHERQWECGFCNATLSSWDERAKHIPAHFREGKDMTMWQSSSTIANWTLDTGFDYNGDLHNIEFDFMEDLMTV